MKKLFTFALLFVCTLGFTQTICKNVDEFNGETNYITNTGVVIKQSPTLAFKITPYLNEYNGKIIFSELLLIVVGVGCIETGSELIIIFENGEKASFTGWNKFNCDGNMFASLTVKGDELFKSQKITKMQFTNKSNYKTITGTVSPNQKDYFIKVFKALDLGNEKGFDTCKAK